MHFWYWLGNNSSQLQAVAGLLAVIVAMAVGFVAFRQAEAAGEQAVSAKAQAETAAAQTEAVRQQVAASKQQLNIMWMIADTQTQPHISMTPSAGKGGEIIQQSITFLNNGSGTA